MIEKLKKIKQADRRKRLMFGGVGAVLLVCLFVYLTGGRYVTTDNAYVKASKIMLTPQVTGPIVAVTVADNQHVKQGDLLATIDQAPYKIALEQAKADLASAQISIEQLKAQYRQIQANIAQAKAELDFAQKDYDRKKSLAHDGATSKSTLDDALRRLQVAQKAYNSLQEEADGTLAALMGNADIALAAHPLYQKAQAALEQAELNMTYTELKAPVAGVVGSAPTVGDYARAGAPLLNMVASENVWVEANYKETELTNVKVGQPVTIEVDAYPGHEWRGHVESISPASGAEFSVLPAQNATGNWVKVVQRIPLRAAVDEGPKDLVLRTGMSTNITIDTGDYPHLPFM